MAASDGAAAALQTDAPRRHLMRRAATVGLLMRNCVGLVVALVALADPASARSPAGTWVLVIVAMWSAYRIATRSHGRAVLTVDLLLVLVVCAAIPMLSPDPHFYLTNSAPQAIAGTAVISFAVSVPARLSLPITLAVAAGYAWGSAQVVGWDHVAAVAALYYFALQWSTSVLIRLMVLRVADAVGQARAGRRAAELVQQVNDAVWEFDREQLALLHDTAASTLLMVGQGAVSSPERLAAQARRDLQLLQHGPWIAPPERLQLVGELRDAAAHLVTPVEFDGLGEIWLPGETGRLVLAAAREVMNNVDRHAAANLLRISVFPNAVLCVDDGVGFKPEAHRSGHGVTDSIIDRMARAGGQAQITSSPGAGTSIELRWPPASEDLDAQSAVSDPDRLIDRVRIRYGLALTGYALANLAFAVPQAELAGGGRVADIVLGVVAAGAVLTAVPGILCGRWGFARPAVGALMLVTVLQPLLLPPELVGGYAHWAQNAIGWCALPLLLGVSTGRGAAVLVGLWTLGAATELICRPDWALVVNIGLGTASILAVQLFALLFNGLVRGAAAEAHAETDAHHRLVAVERVSRAVREEYQRRYARLVDNVLPLLRQLSGTGSADADLQRAARAESRRLRALFDQEATFDHPLMRQVRRLVDTAESSGIDVAIDLAGTLPVLESDEIDALLMPLARIVKAAPASIRLVVNSTDSEVSVSIVCEGMADDPQLAADLESAGCAEVVTSGPLVWVLIRHVVVPV
ncbi:MULTISPECIES: sensor histidine kinase [unclassified Mycolicibacterium]|uniref:sensor histidine kinase n=1 Tax=unclassified Mycolicibacterium TaxID=2636767 RepID=UPI002EDAC287